MRAIKLELSMRLLLYDEFYNDWQDIRHFDKPLNTIIINGFCEPDGTE
jgi:hypothetical protein